MEVDVDGERRSFIGSINGRRYGNRGGRVLRLLAVDVAGACTGTGGVSFFGGLP